MKMEKTLIRRGRRRQRLGVFAVLLAFLFLYVLTDRLLRPKYMETLVEGSMISQYYREAGGHEVIFIGDCEVYANFSPMEMYRSQGITAYVRGSSQQLIWQSYYILKETLRYETPKVIVYNVNALRYGEPISEAYNRLTIDCMRWSPEKVGIIRASMTKEESFLSYVFPILRYHSRFDELSGEDFRYLFSTKDNTYNGFLMNKNVKAAGALPTKKPLAETQFAPVCYDYLDRMVRLCRENGIELVLIKAPSLYPYWYEEYDAQVAQYARENGLKYYDLTKCAEEIGIDYTLDTYDGGLHLNLTGATKLSVYFAEKLAQDFALTDYRGDKEVSAVYDEKLARYDQAAQS